jgi:hypothetical protein
MWTFRISTGNILGNGLKIGHGYSGFGDCANDPKKVAVKMQGPIPPGKYRIEKAYTHLHLGPITMNLEPLPGTEMHGRSLFRIHGDNSTPAPFDGSHGCIILNRAVRTAINNSRDRILEVIE